MMLMMGLWMLIPLLVLIGAVALALGWRPRGDQPSKGAAGESPMDILGARYARGEISREEYEQVRRDLGG